MEHKRPVAAFDIDGTIFRSSLLIELVEELVKREIFPTKARKLYESAHEDWLNRKGEYGPFIQKLVLAFGTYAKGLPYGELADVAGEIIEATGRSDREGEPSRERLFRSRQEVSRYPRRYRWNTYREPPVRR